MCKWEPKNTGSTYYDSKKRQFIGHWAEICQAFAIIHNWVSKKRLPRLKMQSNYLVVLWNCVYKCVLIIIVYLMRTTKIFYNNQICDICGHINFAYVRLGDLVFFWLSVVLEILCTLEVCCTVEPHSTGTPEKQPSALLRTWSRMRLCMFVYNWNPWSVDTSLFHKVDKYLPGLYKIHSIVWTIACLSCKIVILHALFNSYTIV